jgi:hypothetical protein
LLYSFVVVSFVLIVASICYLIGLVGRAYFTYLTVLVPRVTYLSDAVIGKAEFVAEGRQLLAADFGCSDRDPVGRALSFPWFGRGLFERDRQSLGINDDNGVAQAQLFEVISE